MYFKLYNKPEFIYNEYCVVNVFIVMYLTQFYVSYMSFLYILISTHNNDAYICVLNVCVS